MIVELIFFLAKRIKLDKNGSRKDAHPIEAEW